MVLDAFSILLLFSATIILGYIGSIIFEKTGIPDIIWLLLLGIVLGSVLNLIEIDVFISALPFFSSLALIIILFDAGLNLNFYQVVRGFSRSMLLAATNFAFCMGLVTLISVYVIGFDLLRGILLGSILGGTSSAVVLSITGRLRIREKIKTLLNLESIFTDPLTIVFTIAVAGVITNTSSASPVNTVFSAFSVGAVLGLMSGIVWLSVLDKLKGRPFDYMLTLSVIFILYVFTEYVGGSGSISSLAFGLVLGNGKTFSEIFKFSKQFHIDHLFRTFQSEISFLVRSFFFVYLGIIVTINTEFLVYGIMISSALICCRFITEKICAFGMDNTREEADAIRIMAPRGLATAVISNLPATMGIPGAELFSQIGFLVIITTTIYTTLAVKVVFRKLDEDGIEKRNEEEIMKAEREITQNFSRGRKV